MPLVIHKISCNLQYKTARQIVHAKQGDFGDRVINVTLYNGDSRLLLASSYTKEFAYCRPDGVSGTYRESDEVDNPITSVDENSTVAIVLTPAVLEVPGIVECELRLIAENSRIATFTFHIYVEKSVTTGNDGGGNDGGGNEGGNVTPLPTTEKTKLYGFDSEAAYNRFTADYPNALASNDIVIIKGTTSDSITHTFYAVQRSGTEINLQEKHVISVLTSTGGTGAVSSVNSRTGAVTLTEADTGGGYAECYTAATTVTKVATIANYRKIAGGTVKIKFVNAVPANATLNISSKGAAAIYYHGSAITAGVINADTIATLSYDGTHYCVLALDNAYQKPEHGIPAADLAQGVQASLGNANTALQPGDIEANASGTAAGTLSNLKIGETIYSIPQPTAPGEPTGGAEKIVVTVSSNTNPIVASMSSAQIYAAVSAGKIVEMKYNGYIMQLMYVSTESASFSSHIYNNNAIGVIVAEVVGTTVNIESPAIATTPLVESALSQDVRAKLNAFNSSNYYTKAEINAALDNYIEDVAALIGGDA